MSRGDNNPVHFHRGRLTFVYRNRLPFPILFLFCLRSANRRRASRSIKAKQIGQQRDQDVPVVCDPCSLSTGRETGNGGLCGNSQLGPGGSHSRCRGAVRGPRQRPGWRRRHQATARRCYYKGHPRAGGAPYHWSTRPLEQVNEGGSHGPWQGGACCFLDALSRRKVRRSAAAGAEARDLYDSAHCFPGSDSLPPGSLGTIKCRGLSQSTNKGKARVEQSRFAFRSSADTQPQQPITFALPEASLLLWEAFLSQSETNALFTTLLQQTPWKHEAIRSYDKVRLLPRPTAWYGDPGARYHYSGIRNEPLPWTPLLNSLRARVQTCTGHAFNSVLLNLYRSGADSLSWHQDNEPELGERPVIGRVPPACG